jgi:hypothetical protein
MDKHTHAEHRDFSQKKIVKCRRTRTRRKGAKCTAPSAEDQIGDRNLWIRKFCSEKIEEVTPHAARRSARNNYPKYYPRGVEHHSAVEIGEERKDEEPWSRKGGKIQKLRTWLRVHQLQPELFV